jgi:hypothetical protein
VGAILRDLRVLCGAVEFSRDFGEWAESLREPRKCRNIVVRKALKSEFFVSGIFVCFVCFVIDFFPRSRLRMGRIYPVDFLRILDRGYVEIDHDRLLIAAHDHAGERLVLVGVDLLMRHERRDENKIP